MRLKNTFTLHNGVEIPSIGFGTWQTPDGDTAIHAVKVALKNAGYRHIDAAAVYENEKSVGTGIKESQIPRESLFITSKVWNTERGYDNTMKAFEKTINDLGLEYLDLYLIHWPAASQNFDNWEEINLETWKAMIDLYKSGKVKAIGVSNFKPHHLKALMESAVKPMVNQIEYHPGWTQEDTVAYCKNNQILVEAWSPLGSGRVLNDERLIQIASKYNKSVAQICVRWCLQNDILPLPKSITDERIVENIDVFDFEIAQEDMDAINSFEVFGESGLDPDKVNF